MRNVVSSFKHSHSMLYQKVERALQGMADLWKSGWETLVLKRLSWFREGVAGLRGKPEHEHVCFCCGDKTEMSIGVSDTGQMYE